MNVHVKLYFMMYGDTYYPHFLYIIHNIQLRYDHCYVNLITYFHHVVKLYMLNVKMMDINFHIIFQIMFQFI
jgi:hypothetical protein